MLSRSVGPLVEARRGHISRRVLSCLLVVVLVGAFLPTVFAESASADGPYALQFDGTNDYVTFGVASGLGTATFTLETWFYWTGGGATAQSGSGGVTGIPLITKGRNEADNVPADCNYFLGIQTAAAGGRLLADFEEGAAGTTPGLNHPITGYTTVTPNVWHHVAVTYNGNAWNLYLDGNPEGTATVGQPPRSNSTQHAALGSALNSGGTPNGYFAGMMDEARIWNYARTQAEIETAMNLEITSDTGLLGRWGMDEGSGATIVDSTGGEDGTLTNGPTWVAGGAPFNLPVDPGAPPSPHALNLADKNTGGTADYVTFGDPAKLDLAQFTLETWFRRDGTGTTGSTGTGGLTQAIPLLTHGVGQTGSEGNNLDANWVLAIDDTNDVIAADFEEGVGGTSLGLNHPIVGTTPIAPNTWYHAAATYDGSTWRLYLNGTLEASLYVGQPVRSDSIQHSGLGVFLTSTGGASGHFTGVLDEARVWNYARSQAEIRASINSQIETAETGLVARWGFGEGSGTVIGDSMATPANGTLSGNPRGSSWAGSAPFDLEFDETPPAAPTTLITTAGAGRVSLDWDANSEVDLAGYNVYRADAPGPVVKGTPLNGTLLVPSAYQDTSVVGGTHYFYAVTAVDTSGNESGLSAEDDATPTTPDALDLGSSGAYVTFGDPAKLDLAQFTIETWFMRTGAGVQGSTGTGGINPAIPLVTHAAGEGDGSNIDANWALVIADTDDVIAADFEEGPGGPGPLGQNHPVYGSTAISNDVWYHAAVTYDGTTWRLYLNGHLEAELTLAAGVTPRSDSIQHSGLGAMLRSDGTPVTGRFDGVLDEVRVWNRALTQTEIKSTINAELTGSEADLVALWDLDDGSGTAVADSAGTPANGTITGTGYAWTSGAPFDVDITPPVIAAHGNEIAEATGPSGAVVTYTKPTATDEDPPSPVVTCLPASGSAFALDDTTVNCSATDAHDNVGTSSFTVTVQDTTPPVVDAVSDITTEATGPSGAAVTFTKPSATDLVDGSVPVSCDYSSGSTFPIANTLVICSATDSHSNPGQSSFTIRVQDTTPPQLVGTPADMQVPATGPSGAIVNYTPPTATDLVDGSVPVICAPASGTPFPMGPTQVDCSATDTHSNTAHSYFTVTVQDATAPVFDPYADITVEATGPSGAVVSYPLPVAHDDDPLLPTVSCSPIPGSTFALGQTTVDCQATDNALNTGYTSFKVIVEDTTDPVVGIHPPITEEATGPSGAVVTYTPPTAVDLVDGSVPVSCLPASLSTFGLGDTTVTCSATDSHGNTGTSQFEVTVEDTTLPAFDPYADITETATSPSGAIVNYPLPTATDLVDPSPVVDCAPPPGHLFPIGETIVNCTATDDAGNIGYSTFKVTVSEEPDSGLSLGTGSAYVTFGDPAKLDLPQFTIETWFRRTGAGTPVSQTGTSGIPNAIPLMTHGSPEDDGSNVDANWMLVIADNNDVLGADFEDYATGLNHPILGTTPIVNNQWYHAAATYDGGTWKLYLNGHLEATLYVGQAPRYDSIQRSGLGAFLESDGTANGHFTGVLDEARVWNYARTQAQIVASTNSELTSGTGLVARWGFGEGAGAVVGDSMATPADGTITGTGTSWVAGAPFDLDFEAPAAPTALSATAGEGQVSLDWNDNGEADLAGYNVYRSLGSPVAIGMPVNGALLASSAYLDTAVVAGTEYFYAVTAVDDSGNESGLSGEDSATPSAPTSFGLDLGSGSAYVTFGDPAKLDLPQFTIETWFKRTGEGTIYSTGSSGITNALPLVTHGASYEDGGVTDINWVLVIDNDTDVLGADFEEGIGGTSLGLNHPVLGTTPIVNNVWYHAAATYDGSMWNLYLNGELETSLYVGQPVRSNSTNHAGLGTFLRSTGASQGHFTGVLDETRVWNYACTQAQIVASINSELTSGTGLVARWGMNEGSGSSVGDSIATVANGTITGTGTTWVAGAPFDLVVNTPPNLPVLVAPSDGATDVPVPVTLSVEASDPDGGSLDVDFHGRSVSGVGGGEPFTLVVVPDTQFYSESYPATFTAQMQWIVNQQAARNIVFVTHLGDIVNVATTESQWGNADASITLLDGQVPYGLAPGNHDLTDSPMGTHFNAHFPASRYGSQPWYGGHYGSDNLNSWQTFEGSGMQFLILHLANNATTSVPTAAVLDWAESVVAAHPGYRVILNTHDYLETDGTRDAVGEGIWTGLVRDNCAIDLVLSGHYTGAARATSTNTCGEPVLEVLQDYQGLANGGSGYLRYFEFQPATDEIDVYTYSPTLDTFRTGADQFTLSYDMSGGGSWAKIGATQTVASGGTASVSWLSPTGVGQEWYATVSDGAASTEGPHWTFSAEVPPAAPVVTNPGAQSSLEGAVVSLQIVASDPNGDTLGYSATGLPANLSIDTGTGLISGTVAAGAAAGSPYHVTVTVDDGQGGSTPVSFDWTVSVAGAYGIDLGDGSGYVSFGDPAKLDLGQFTIETWFKRTGPGVPYQTSGGIGGIAEAIPLVTHGASESDGSSIDANWMLVIDDATDVLAADFEDMAEGLNHAVLGTTTVTSGVWHHAAATYDGTTWKLYLDGNLEATLVVGESPRSDSIQPAGLGAFLQSDGTPLGHFEGVLDEVRVWNTARSQAQIAASINLELTSGSGLVARWGMGEPSGTVVGDSIAPEADGTVIGSGVSRVAGAPFDMVINTPPDVPALVVPADGATGLLPPVTLSVEASDPDGGSLDVDFYGRSVSGVGGGEPFTLVVIPDTQFYSESYPATFTAQTQWIVNQVAARNIVFVTHMGDLVDDDVESQWVRADTSMSLLDGAVPYGVLPGNHDLDDGGTRYNNHFGPSRFAGYSWYGGHYGSDNMNNWETFEGSGMQFLILHLQYAPSSAVLAWADDVIDAHPGYQVIVSTHDYLNTDGTRDANGNAIWNGLVEDNCPIFLVLAGHNHAAARRTDANSCGDTVHQIMQNYQELANGGNGFLRYYVFDPAADEIDAYTYSPTLDTFRTGADQFTLSYDMSGGGSWAKIGATQTVASGGTASVSWLSPTGVGQEWYATVSDGAASTTGPTWTFGIPDATPPVVADHPDMVVEATSPAGAVVTYTPPTATDDDPPNPVVTCLPASGSTFSVAGSPHTVTCSATDTAGNTGTSTFTITVFEAGAFGIDLGSGSGYVSFGDPAKLDLGQFTLETWFKRTGAGVPYQTSGGTGGIAAALPLVTHGASESDGSNVDANWMLVIDDATDVIAADFEDMASGQNHSVVGTTPIVNGVWYHAAATYDGSTWRLYLNGNLEATLVVGQTPRSDSIQPAGLGAFIQTGGTPLGHFQGVLDETRVWNYARSQAQIATTVNSQLTGPQSGLVARWGMGEPVGAVVGDSISPKADGTIIGTGVSRVAGAPFDLVVNLPPDEPTLPSPADGATNVPVPVALSVTASDPNGGNVDVDFFGRAASGSSGEPFTLVVLPDTQFYSESYPATFTAQTQWIVNQQAARNIVFATHLGDIVNQDAVESQWVNADTSMSFLDGHVPYAFAPGNHDMADGWGPQFNAHFGVARYSGESWYGGHYGSTNLSSWQTFDGSGMQFLILHLRDAPSAAVLTWAAGVVAAHPGYRVIVSTHQYLDTSGNRDSTGDSIWNGLVRDNCSIFLVLNGHYHGAARSTATNSCGGTVHQVLQDYQSLTGGGSGFLRYYEFDPAADEIDVFTYSPTLGTFRTGVDQFTLSYDMEGGGSWAQIGATQTVASGGTASVTWPGISGGEYEWYATVSDASATTTGPDWTFTVEEAPPTYGFLRVVTNPAVMSQILVDGVPMDTWGLTWVKLPPGDYTVSFTAVPGFATPAPRVVMVVAGETAETIGQFVERGWLRVITSPAVPSTISVDGVVRNEWGMWTDLPAGSYQVCFGAVEGFVTPGCQTAVVSTGLTTITGNFVAGTSDPLPAHGFLRVTTSPAVMSQILVNGIPRDTWGLTWVKLPPGDYTVSFTAVPGFTTPAPRVVTVTEGQTTETVGLFGTRGWLRVITSPAVPSTISVDGVPRDDWGMWTDLPAGSFQVCFGDVEGFTTPACQPANLTAGETTTITGNFG